MEEGANDLAVPVPDSRWLRRTRVIVLVPVGFTLFYILAFCVPRFGSTCYDDTWPLAIFLLILILPYMLSAKGLWGRKLKKGLAWAIVAGTFWGAIACLALVVSMAFVADGEIMPAIISGSLALTQIALVVSAVKLYRLLEREDGDRWLFGKRALLLLPYVLSVVVAAVSVLGSLPSKVMKNEVSVIGAMRTITTAEAAYQETYRKGYSSSLAALGPPSAGSSPSGSAAALLDDRLASGASTDYILTYTPGAATVGAEILTYTLTAIPANSRCTNWRRFFTDQTGIIRWTRGKGAPTAQDPPIE